MLTCCFYGGSTEIQNDQTQEADYMGSTSRGRQANAKGTRMGAVRIYPTSHTVKVPQKAPQETIVNEHIVRVTIDVPRGTPPGCVTCVVETEVIKDGELVLKERRLQDLTLREFAELMEQWLQGWPLSADLI